MSLFVSIATATTFAAFGFQYTYYQCWYSWACSRVHLVLLAYFALAGGGGGLLGWMVANISNAQPASSPAVSGVLYGVGGALALRADFRPRQQRLGVGAAAASLLAKGLLWTERALDEISVRRAEAWLRGLDDDALIEEAYFISANIQLSKSVPSRAKETNLKLLIPAMEKVRDTRTEGNRMEGRAQLGSFCSRYMITEHLAKRIIPVVAEMISKQGGSAADRAATGQDS